MPLTPLSSTALNTRLPHSPSISPKPIDSSAATPLSFEKAASKPAPYEEVNWDEEASSPFVTELPRDAMDSEQKSGPSTEDFTESTALSPSSQLKMESAPFKICEDETSTPAVKKGSTPVSPSKTMHRTPSASTSLAGQSDFLDNTVLTTEEEANVDDTCFSAFSEIPNVDMTRFAQMRMSPSKQSVLQDQTWRTAQQTPNNTVRHSRESLLSSSPSATPKATTSKIPPGSTGNTTNLLLDFTEQFDAIASYTHHVAHGSARRSPTKSSTESNLLSYLQTQRHSPRKSTAPQQGTPSRKNLLNLLDFELPPAPTPRSIPSISIRELESFKSQYASEISSLKATLSGREAEVEALKRAVSDAETRVGEAIEASREERARRQSVEREREDWERRGIEFQNVLTKVKAEVIELDRERGELAARLEAAEDKAQEADARAAEAEERAAKAESRNFTASASSTGGSSENGAPMFTAEQVQKQIDEKVHALSAELHAIYKKKHVTKVAGLKKGFEAKAKEATVTLQARIEELEKANEDLQNKIDGTLSGVLPTASASLNSGLSAEEQERRRRREEEDRKKLEEQAAVIERQKAELAGRETELKTQKSEFVKIMAELEQERVEKGELVAAVDEMLALQADMSVLTASVSANSTVPGVNSAAMQSAANAMEEMMRKSVGLGTRPSGLARPGFGFGAQGSRIAGPSGLAKPPALGGKSRMMSNIERMGGRSAD